MSVQTFNLSAVGSVTMLNCAHCGVLFGISEDYETRRRADHQQFYCPNGHKNVFFHQTEKERRIEELEAALTRERMRAENAEKSRKWAESSLKGARIAAGKAKAERNRIEHRVNRGVCPHCRRTVQEMAAHIKSKHPECVK